MEKILMLRNHIFVVILSADCFLPDSSSGVVQSSSLAGDKDDSAVETKPIQAGLSGRYRHFVEHALLPHNRNAVYLAVIDGQKGPGSRADLHSSDNVRTAKCLGFTFHAAQDQLVTVADGQDYETRLWTLLLQKLAGLPPSRGDHMRYHSMLRLQLRQYQATPRVTAADAVRAIGDLCESPLSKAYRGALHSLLTKELCPGTEKRRPLLLYSPENPAMSDWTAVRAVTLQLASSFNLLVLEYDCCLSELNQDLDTMLIQLLSFFKVLPKENCLPFTTFHMSTFLSDCLRSPDSLSDSQGLLLVVHSVDWLCSAGLAASTCSWLPEKTAANVVVVLTAPGADQNSPQQRHTSLRMQAPLFLSVSADSLLGSGLLTATGAISSAVGVAEEKGECRCQQSWCLIKSARLPAKFEAAMVKRPDCKEIMVDIMALFSVSTKATFSLPELTWIISNPSKCRRQHHAHFDLSSLEDNDPEKESQELSEKAVWRDWETSCCPDLHCGAAVSLLLDMRLLGRIGSEVRLAEGRQSRLAGRLHKGTLQARLAALLVVGRSCISRQLLLVPGLLGSLCPEFAAPLARWLAGWPLLQWLSCADDEYSVPARLLALWRSVGVGAAGMLHWYSAQMVVSRCVLCSSVPLEWPEPPSTVDPVNLVSELLPPEMESEFGPCQRQQRARLALLWARLCLQAGQYGAAKVIARSLLKLLDRRHHDYLLADTLHLLFCTLDERLKTFEFVTEQTTPLFRRTVHYGARAVIEQQRVVARLRRLIGSPQQNLLVGTGPSGDGCGHSSDEEYDNGSMRAGVALASESVRLARMMTHFVFSLDGVEQASLVQRDFAARDVRAVTIGCLSGALAIALQYKERQLLLEIHMTFGVVQPRDCFRSKILLYKTPLRQAICLYGEGHIFVSRLYINIGISHEEQQNYLTAFNCFTKWSQVTHELLGRDHCKAIRSCGVFQEPIFRQAATFVEGMNGLHDDRDGEHHQGVEVVDADMEHQLRSLIAGTATSSIIGTNLHVRGVTYIGRANIGSHGDNDEEDVWEAGSDVENVIAAASSNSPTPGSAAAASSHWEMLASDDETPAYAEAFEQVLDAYKPPQSHIGHPHSGEEEKLVDDLLANSSLVESADVAVSDIEYLHRATKSQMAAMMINATDETELHRQRESGQIGEAPGTRDGMMPTRELGDEGMTMTRMFHDLQELADWIQSSQTSQSDVSLTRRLQELQRELQDLLNF